MEAPIPTPRPSFLARPRLGVLVAVAAALLALPACGDDQELRPVEGGSTAAGTAMPEQSSAGRPPAPAGGATTAAEAPDAGEPGQTATTEHRFTRFVSTGDTEGTYQTAVVSYEDAKGRQVDLVGVVHIGDAAYYAGLRSRLDGYDSVLYELVAEKGTRPERGHKSDSPVSALQRFLKQSLELEFQLDQVDYSKPNFVHADLSPAEMARKMEERGESIWTYVLRSMLNPPPQDGNASKITALHFLAGFFSADRARYHKFLLAQMLDDIELTISSLGAEKGKESVLIGDRNAACMKVLDTELAKDRRKVAIFYGAGHLPDMEARLLERGFKQVGSEWLVAWDLRIARPEGEGGAAGGDDAGGDAATAPAGDGGDVRR
ncbi:MAG: hypothetical protein R3F30_06320 [Planctomycetota bacterium]